jgi:hypothetical protein
MTDLKQELLTELRERLGMNGFVEKRDYLNCQTVPEGVPRGVICEIVGSARTEWILSLLKENPSLYIFWAEEKLTILPTAIHQRGIELDRILIAETGEKLFQALRKALKSKLFDCIVLPGAIIEIKMLKALQLFARESNSCVFFLSKTPQCAWAIPFQLEAEWTLELQSISIKVLKAKFSQVENA